MVLNRINSWLVNRLPSRRTVPKIRVDTEGLHLTSKNTIEDILWSDINGIEAIRTEQWIGDTLVCVIDLADGRSFSVNEHDPAWKAVVTQIPRSLSGALKYEEWTVPLVAGAERIRVFEREQK
jgi:hypothetical protein